VKPEEKVMDELKLEERKVALEKLKSDIRAQDSLTREREINSIKSMLMLVDKQESEEIMLARKLKQSALRFLEKHLDD
jgi:hypothetical protein